MNGEAFTPDHALNASNVGERTLPGGILVNLANVERALLLELRPLGIRGVVCVRVSSASEPLMLGALVATPGGQPVEDVALVKQVSKLISSLAERTRVRRFVLTPNLVVDPFTEDEPLFSPVMQPRRGAVERKLGREVLALKTGACYVVS